MIIINNREYPNAVLIGLCSSTGPQSGKSTVSRLVVKKYPTATSRIFSFAERLKELCAFIATDVLLWDPEEVRQDNFKNEILFDPHPDQLDVSPVTYRDLLIQVGTKYYREKVDRDHWVKMLTTDLERYLQATEGLPRIVLIDDVRFLNEFDAVVGMGGQVFNVVNTQGSSAVTDAGDLPPELFQPSRTVLNDKTNPPDLSNIHQFIQSRGL